MKLRQARKVARRILATQWDLIRSGLSVKHSQAVAWSIYRDLTKWNAKYTLRRHGIKVMANK